MTPDDPAPTPVALEYARSLHAATIAANAALYTRAQVVLSLNGILLSILGGVVITNPADLRKTISIFGVTTWLALAVAGAALAASILAAALVIRPRGNKYSGQTLECTPINMWFFARIAQLKQDDFVSTGERMDAAFEIRVHLNDVTVMAPTMVRRVKRLSLAFFAMSLELLAFTVATADYLIRLS